MEYVGYAVALVGIGMYKGILEGYKRKRCAARGFGFLFSSQTSISAERNLQKCREFSSIGLHLPAIEQCQKAMRDGVNREAELELLYYLANSYSSINKNKMAKEAITKLLNTSP